MLILLGFLFAFGGPPPFFCHHHTDMIRNALNESFVADSVAGELRTDSRSG